jgi:tetratricopeptide (TPR) repeat protein
MVEIPKEIEEIENQIEEALWSLEMRDEKEKALEIYLEAELKLDALAITMEKSAYCEQQRVLSYCLMRQGNILRQMGKSEEALAISEREIAAARGSENEIALARSLMSNGTNYLVAGGVGKGIELLEKARELFERGDSYDHQQGLGWYWILQADLANAGMIEKEPSEVVEVSDRALEILKPIENWPGVARAYAARASVHEKMGNGEAAAGDRQEQQYYESKVEAEEEGAG